VNAAAGSDRTVVIVGASVAGVRCATSLRNAGFEGTVVLLDSDAGAPYDKPQLSKRIDSAARLDLIVEESTLRELRIDFRPAVAATGLDLATGVVETAGGPVPFDELVIATGCRPRPLAHPLPAQAGYLRTRDDWRQLKEAVTRGGRLVVVGAGFLGLEAAAAAVSLGMEVTVVDVAPRVLMRGIPTTVAERVAARHVDAGVELRLGAQGPVLDGDDQTVRVDGARGDYALVSVGALPNVEWLAGSGLTIEDGVVCDANLAAAPGVWAVGDCARWVNARYGRLERHEHWTTAGRHAQHVARSIATASTSPMAEVPYVWSDQLGWRLQAIGRVGTEELHFASGNGVHLAISATDQLVTGVTTINAQALCVAARRLLQQGDPTVEEVVEALAPATRDFARIS